MKIHPGVILLIVAMLLTISGCATQIPCPAARCCKYTYVISGKTYVKYYSLPSCPANPAYKDVGPCPVCPPAAN